MNHDHPVRWLALMLVLSVLCWIGLLGIVWILIGAARGVVA
jgi:hypothetical protein